MPALPVLSGHCGRAKEIMFAEVLWEDPFKTIKCYINVARVHGIGTGIG